MEFLLIKINYIYRPYSGKEKHPKNLQHQMKEPNNMGYFRLLFRRRLHVDKTIQHLTYQNRNLGSSLYQIF